MRSPASSPPGPSDHGDPDSGRLEESVRARVGAVQGVADLAEHVEAFLLDLAHPFQVGELGGRLVGSGVVPVGPVGDAAVIDIAVI